MNFLIFQNDIAISDGVITLAPNLMTPERIALSPILLGKALGELPKLPPQPVVENALSVVLTLGGFKGQHPPIALSIVPRHVNCVDWERKKELKAELLEGETLHQYSDGPNDSYLRFFVLERASGETFEFRTFWRAPGGKGVWLNRPPPPANRPLFNLEKIRDMRIKGRVIPNTARIIILANEHDVRKAEDDDRYFYMVQDSKIAFTTLRGVAATDLTPLKGRDVIVIGDANDYPGLSAKFFERLEDAIKEEPSKAPVVIAPRPVGRPREFYHISEYSLNDILSKFPCRGQIFTSSVFKGARGVKVAPEGRDDPVLSIHIDPDPKPKAKNWGFKTQNFARPDQVWDAEPDRQYVIERLSLGPNVKPAELSAEEKRARQEENAARNAVKEKQRQLECELFKTIYADTPDDAPDGPAISYLRDTRRVSVEAARTIYEEIDYRTDETLIDIRLEDVVARPTIFRQDRPKLIVPRRDFATGDVVGFELSVVSPDGEGGYRKGAFWAGVSRVSIGQSDSYMRIREGQGTLAVGEGYITTLSAATLPLAELECAEIWAVGSGENFKHISAKLPYNHFILFVDTDASETGERAAVEAERSLLRAGKRVTLVRCPLPEGHVFPEGEKPNWDFNDVIKRGPPFVEGVDYTVKTSQYSPTLISFDRFEMTEQGLYVSIERAKGEAVRRWVCDPFEVLGYSHDEAHSGWGVRLRTTDKTGRKHIVTIQNAELQGESSKSAATLADLGLTIIKNMQTALQEYLIRVKPQKVYTFADRTGWRYVGDKWFFVMPERTIGGEGADLVVLNKSGKSLYAQKGTVLDWKTNVAEIAGRHDMGVYAICVGFAGPLLRYAGQTSLGNHGLGASGKGKTTLQCLAASVWGKGATGMGGYILSWNSTANALEAAASMATDTLLVLDELGEVEARDFGRAIYALANGVGKGRADRTGAAREPRTWRVSTFSSGEFQAEVKVQENKGQKYRGGQEVRLLDIPVVKNDQLGVFDKVEVEGKEVDYAKLSNEIKSKTAQHYGVAGPAFVEWLVASRTTEETVKEMVQKFVDDNTPKNADGNVKRALTYFGLAAVAGELAITAGLVPWEEKRAETAAKEAFKRWCSQRGRDDDKSFEAQQAIETVRAVIEQHGSSRFQAAEIPPDMTRSPVIHNRLGWRKGEGVNCQWLILPTMWKDVVCAGLSPKDVAIRLIEGGYMEAGSGKDLSKPVKIPSEGGRTVRVYVIKANILAGYDETEVTPQPDLELTGGGETKNKKAEAVAEMAEDVSAVTGGKALDDDIPF